MAAKASPATRVAERAGALVAVHAYEHDPRAPYYALGQLYVVARAEGMSRATTVGSARSRAGQS